MEWGGGAGDISLTTDPFSLIWRRHRHQCRAAYFDLISELMAFEQLGFFSAPHLLWHGASVYNGHLQGPVTLTPVVGLAVDLSLPVFTTTVCCGWDSNSRPSACRTNALNHCANAAVVTSRNVYKNSMHKNKIQSFDVEYLIYFQSETVLTKINLTRSSNFWRYLKLTYEINSIII